MKENNPHFKAKFESRNSIRDFEIASEKSLESYEISPYSMRIDPILDMRKVFSGAFFILLGLIIFLVGAKKTLSDIDLTGEKYWISSVVFISFGIGIIFHALKMKYSVLEDDS